jgi:hypothetical protein
MERDGLCDDRDMALHKEEEDKKTVQYASHSSSNRDQDYDLAGEQCWLQFVAFDVSFLRQISY